MKTNSLWKDAFYRLAQDKIALGAFIIVLIYFSIALSSGFGWIASSWSQEVGASNLSPSLDHIFGTDIFGRSVFLKVIRGTQVAMSVGVAAAIIAIPIGVILGALAGYFGGWVDDLVTWLSTTFSSVPNIMLLISITLILGKGIFSVYVALGATSWVNLCRLIRGEVIKHKEREYVQAAGAIGGGHFRKLFRHILPNVSHIIIINTSMQFQVAIKSEVILSYLGLGVQGEPSWGTMIDDAKLELVRGVWWQLAGATLAMFLILLAFNVLGDALRDALDPKLKGK